MKSVVLKSMAAYVAIITLAVYLAYAFCYASLSIVDWGFMGRSLAVEIWAMLSFGGAVLVGVAVNDMEDQK